MNTETGQVREVTQDEIQQLNSRDNPLWVPVKRLPVPFDEKEFMVKQSKLANCKRCKGTGSYRKGTRNNGRFIPCRCVL